MTQDNSYPLGIDQGAETARLVDQDVVLTRNMGGLFPVPVDSATEWSVLDLACGPGSWALEVARAYPEMTITGVDLSKTMQASYAPPATRISSRQSIYSISQREAMDTVRGMKIAESHSNCYSRF